MSEKLYKREYKLKALQCKIEKELRDLRCLQRAHEEEERYKAHGLVKDLLPSTQKHPQHDGVTSFYAKYKQGYRKGWFHDASSCTICKERQWYKQDLVFNKKFKES